MRLKTRYNLLSIPSRHILSYLVRFSNEGESVKMIDVVNSYLFSYSPAKTKAAVDALVCNDLAYYDDAAKKTVVLTTLGRYVFERACL